MLPLREIHADRAQPVDRKSEVADLYERKGAAKRLAAGLGAAPGVGLGSVMLGGLAGIFGVRRPR